MVNATGHWTDEVRQRFGLERHAGQAVARRAPGPRCPSDCRCARRWRWPPPTTAGRCSSSRTRRGCCSAPPTSSTRGRSTIRGRRTRRSTTCCAWRRAPSRTGASAKPTCSAPSPGCGRSSTATPRPRRRRAARRRCGRRRGCCRSPAASSPPIARPRREAVDEALGPARGAAVGGRPVADRGDAAGRPGAARARGSLHAERSRGDPAIAEAMARRLGAAPGPRSSSPARGASCSRWSTAPTCAPPRCAITCATARSVHLEDLLLRRARLGMWQPELAREVAAQLRPLAAAELGWRRGAGSASSKGTPRRRWRWSPEGVL